MNRRHFLTTLASLPIISRFVPQGQSVSISDIAPIDRVSSAVAVTDTPWGVCDTCGKPATMFARDIVKRVNPSGRYWEAQPFGDDIKRGCDDHPVESETYFL